MSAWSVNLAQGRCGKCGQHRPIAGQSMCHICAARNRANKRRAQPPRSFLDDLISRPTRESVPPPEPIVLPVGYRVIDGQPFDVMFNGA